MVMSPAWHEILIGCELDNIRFYAGEIGFFKRFLENRDSFNMKLKSEISEETKQRCNFFINYSMIEMENSNDRIKELRSELEAYRVQHPDN